MIKTLKKSKKSKAMSPKVYLPSSEEDIRNILLDIVNDIPVIVNLSCVDEQMRLRYIDFLSGFIVSRHGYRQKLEDFIFCFSLKPIES